MAQNATQAQLAELERQEQAEHENEQALHDLSVLFPNQTIFIQGESITVHEYPFVQWLQLRQQYSSFIEKFTDLMTHADDVLVDDIINSLQNSTNSC